MAEERATILALLQDRVSSPLKQIGQGFQQLGKVAATTGTALTAPFRAVSSAIGAASSRLLSFRTLITAAVGAGLSASLTRFVGDFATQVEQIGVLSGRSGAALDRIADGIRAIARETGQSLSELADGLREMVQSGFDAEGALVIVARASKLVIATGGSLSDALKGLNFVLQAFNLGAERAKDVSDLLFRASQAGAGTIGELATALSRVGTLAKESGVGLEDVTAAVTVLANSGLVARENVSVVRDLLLSLNQPSEQAAEAAKKLGIEWNRQALEAKGLSGVLVDLDKAAAGSTERIRGLGEESSLPFLLRLAAGSAREFSRTLAKITDDTQTLDAATARVSSRLGVQLSRMRASFQDLFLQVGLAAEPFLRNVASRLAAFVNSIAARRQTIQEVIGLIAEGAERAFDVVSTAFAKGDVLTLIVNYVKGIIPLVVNVITAAVPVLISAVRLLATEVANAFVKAFIAETGIELARKVRGGGFSGQLASLIGFVGGVDTQKLVDQLHEVEQIEGRILRLQENIRLAIDAAARAGEIAKLELDLKVPSTPFDPGTAFGRAQAGIEQSRRDAVAQRITELRNLGNLTQAELDAQEEKLKKSIAERDALMFGLGDDPTKAARETAKQALFADFRALGDKIESEAEALIAGLGTGTSDEMRASIQRFRDFAKSIKSTLSVTFDGKTFSKDALRQGLSGLKEMGEGLVAGIERIGVDMVAKAREVARRVGAAFAIPALRGAQRSPVAPAAPARAPREFGPGEDLTTVMKTAFDAVARFEQERERVQELVRRGLILPKDGADREKAQLGALQVELQGVRDRILEAKAAGSSIDRVAMQKALDNLKLLGLRARDAAKAIPELLQPTAALIEAGSDVGEVLAQAFGRTVSAIADLTIALFQGQKSFREFAAAFIADIGRMIVQLLIFQGLKSVFDAVGIPIGQEGGTVEKKMHGGIIRRFARGTERVVRAAAGIFVPGPRSVRADVVPALLAPGEAVIRREAVDLYGPMILRMINQMLVPPDLLRRLVAPGAAAAHAAAAVAPNVTAFRSGGVVGGVRRSAGQQTQVLPAFPADERTMDVLLQGGGATLRRYFRNHAGDFRAALGISARPVI